jgi:hypothetical protein
MIRVMDRYLALPAKERQRFRVGRRLAYYRSLEDLQDPDLRRQVDQIIDQLGRPENKEEAKPPEDVERAIYGLMENYI